MSDTLANLHPAKRFASFEEAEKLERHLEALSHAGKIDEIPVGNPVHPSLEEHWYRERSTGVVYRYCPPEFPSRGVWERIQ